VSPRSAEYDAAYFTLLRAQEERDGLLRYGEYLDAELDRLDRFTTALNDSAEPVPRKVRRSIDATTKPVLEAVGRRRAVILEERRRMPDRIAAAERFVEECELEVASLRA